MTRSLLIVTAALALAACGPSPQPVVYQQPPVQYQQGYPQQAPVIVQQDHGMSAGTAAALGAGAGFLAGRLTAPTPAAPAPAPVYVAPTVRQQGPSYYNAPVVTPAAAPTPVKPAPVAVGATKAGGNAITFAKPSGGINLSKKR